MNILTKKRKSDAPIHTPLIIAKENYETLILKCKGQRERERGWGGGGDNMKTCRVHVVKENQEGFPKLSLVGREGDRGRLGGSTLVALSLLSPSLCSPSLCKTAMPRGNEGGFLFSLLSVEGKLNFLEGDKTKTP